MGSGDSPATQTAVDVPGFQPSGRFYAAFSSLCIVILAAALDATSLSTALPIISRELGGSAIEAFWAGTSFLLTSTVFQLTFGSLSQTFGRKYLIILSLVLFTAGSIVAAVAQSFTTLLVGRSVQGVGGGGIISLTEVVITDLVPLRQRGTWFGYGSAVWAIGSVTGPVIGGAFAESASWRWIFWINLPICAVGLVMIIVFLNLNRVPGSLGSKLARFDWTGVSLLTVSATSLLLAVSWGNVMYPWSSWKTIVPLVLGILGLIGFVWYEAEIPLDPIVRIAVFNQRTALVSYLGTCIHGIVLWCLLYYLPLYYECVKGYSAIISGVSVFPETFTVAPASIVVGVLITKLGRFRWAIWGGWTLSTLGMGLLYLLDPRTSIPVWIFLNLVPGVGLGMLFNSLGYATQAGAQEKDSACAASMYTFARSFGQGIGVAVGGAIFDAQFAIKLRTYPALASEAAQLSREASALVEIVKAMNPDSPRRAMIIEAYADSLRVVWATMAGLAFVGLVTSTLTQKLDVNRTHESEQWLQKGEKSLSSATPA
ncbi:Efflux pump [Penicillium macrosclerotiorum]|uniref:Efflux pump n=1 Tax=Penicillium macrosclerotiorum TaxID=303699 RepID=UPI0025470945|nr:Efflux pump [Penicillium macrosclerotiorum]KAJ5674185.1 Efflux pump [Penicillium macrosclerotiorum]